MIAARGPSVYPRPTLWSGPPTSEVRVDRLADWRDTSCTARTHPPLGLRSQPDPAPRRPLGRRPGLRRCRRPRYTPDLQSMTCSTETPSTSATSSRSWPGEQVAELVAIHSLTSFTRRARGPGTSSQSPQGRRASRRPRPPWSTFDNTTRAIPASPSHGATTPLRMGRSRPGVKDQVTQDC
jgi:hypothetical protein